MRDQSNMMPAASHREKVLANAAKLLNSEERDADPAEVAHTFRRFLKIETRRLKLAHDAGTVGHRIAFGFSSVIDIVVKQAFQHAIRSVQSSNANDTRPDGCAVVAIGGYGRAELAPHSDIDLLFLFSSRRLAEMKVVSANLLRLLWDAGLTVGYSFRTVGDCVTTALDDSHLRTALVHTRPLAGNKGLYNSLHEALEKDRRRRIDSFVAAVLAERDARYAKFGGTVCLQEPNVKESAGGLRDYHTALWLGHARFGYRTLNELRGGELVTEHDARRIIRGYDFLWRVRNSAHFLAGRKTERISLDLQPILAKQFGYESGRHSLASEKLMRDYYRHARELHLFNETLQARICDSAPRRARPWSVRNSAGTGEGFSIRGGRVQFEGEPDLFVKNPLTVFNAFAIAHAARVPFGFRLREALADSLLAVTSSFRSSPAVADALFKLLRRRGRAGYVLRLMHEVGFLGRLIPEFGRISLLAQHDLYHHFTVDEHSLRAIETLDELHASEDKHRAPIRAVFEEIQDPTLLYLALLLHDVGKGKGRGHIARGAALAERVCKRLHLPESDTKRVVLLVRQHVTMAHLAQRRDLNEPGLIAEFAAELGSLENLNMLLLLTYADLNAVGPGVWTDWKGSLLWDLYRRTRELLTGSSIQIDDGALITQFKAQIAESLEHAFAGSEIERHLALLPDRYRLITEPKAAALHLRMIDELKTRDLVARWQPHGHSSTRLTVCAPDRHGLFSDLAGTLAAHGIEILRAELNTREDGIAIDEFILRQASTTQAVETHRYLKLEQALRDGVSGKLDVGAMVERWRCRHAPRKLVAFVPSRRLGLPRVICDNEASRSATLVEVHAVDEPGLAYKIASALTLFGLEIVCARIATERSDALDVFYITEADGKKLDPEAMKAVENEITRSLTHIDLSLAQPTMKEERKINEKDRSDHQATSA